MDRHGVLAMKGKCRSVNRNCCLGIWNLYFVFQFPNCRARRVSWILHGDIWILKSVQVPKSAARRVIWNLDGPRRFLETDQVLPKSGRPPPSAYGAARTPVDHHLEDLEHTMMLERRSRIPSAPATRPHAACTLSLGNTRKARSDAHPASAVETPRAAQTQSPLATRSARQSASVASTASGGQRREKGGGAPCFDDATAHRVLPPASPPPFVVCRFLL